MKCTSKYNSYDGDYYYDIQCRLEENHKGDHSFCWNDSESTKNE